MDALYWEDFEPGRSFVTEPRTVTAADVEAFADLSGDRNPLHVDPAYAATTPFGGTVAHGVLGLAIATGLLSGLKLTRGTLVALVGIDWRFRAPLRPGDTVEVRLRVASRRDTSQRDRGLVELAAEVVNQRGEVVQEGSLTELVLKRAEGA